MKNTGKNFLVATINKEGQMFTQNNGKLKPIAIIPEHISRITELSENCHIYMDDEGFKAFEEKSFPNRFTRIFVNNKDFEKTANQSFRLHHMDELETIVTRKEFYEPKTRIFFVGSPQFLQLCAKYCDTLMLTVAHVSKKNNTIDFPKDLQAVFGSRKEIQPEMLSAIKGYRKLATVKEEIEIADNGMIIKRKADIEELAKSNMLLIPDYMFYNFRKNKEYDFSYKQYKKAITNSSLLDWANNEISKDSSTVTEPVWRQHNDSDMIEMDNE